MVPVDYDRVSDAGLARIVHEANRAYNVFLDDAVPDAPWDALPEWHKGMIVSRVHAILGGWSAAQIHDEWVDLMVLAGWSYGPVKDPFAKTHPCLRPWEDLPGFMRRKDELAIAVVKTFAREVCVGGPADG